MSQLSSLPRVPELIGPDALALPELARGYKSFGTWMSQILFVMKEVAALQAKVEGADQLPDEQAICNALYHACFLALHLGMYNQEGYQVLAAVHSCELTVRSDIAQSVSRNCSLAVGTIESLSKEVNTDLDQRYQTDVTRTTVRLVEMFLLSLEQLRREIERLATLVSTNEW